MFSGQEIFERREERRVLPTNPHSKIRTRTRTRKTQRMFSTLRNIEIERCSR